VNSAINLRFHKRQGISLLAEQLLVSEEGLCSKELLRVWTGFSWLRFKVQWQALVNMTISLWLP
jgi:hypothetical protein